MVGTAGAETSGDADDSVGMEISGSTESEGKGVVGSDISVAVTDSGGKGVSGNCSDVEDGVDVISFSSSKAGG